jgi:hypothetical protein
MKLSDLRDALLEVIPDVFHYEAKGKPDKYIVWAEDNEASSLNADNKKDEQVIEGTIDYFTKTEYDDNVVLIQQKLNSIDVSWRLSSIQHEQDTGYIHYEWIFELIGELI